MSDVITVRIQRKTKEKRKKYDINVSATVRKALEDHLNEVEQKDLDERLARAKRFGEKIDFELLTKLIREDRESHWCSFSMPRVRRRVRPPNLQANR